MIGREDELFSAFKIEELGSGIDKTAVDVGVDFLTNELNKLNPGLSLDPEANQLIRSFVLDLNTGGDLITDAEGNVSFDPNELIQPWDDESDSVHIFKSWPVMDAEGNIVEKGGFYTESDPRAAPDTELGKYADDLDKQWESYLLNTPKEGRLNRDQWFFATQGGTGEVDEAKVPEGIGKDTGSGLGADFDADVFETDIATMGDIEFDNKFSQDKAFRDTLFKTSATNFTSSAVVGNLTQEKINNELLDGVSKGYFKIGDNVLRFDPDNKVNTINATGGGGGDATNIQLIDPDTGEVRGNFTLVLSGEHAGRIIDPLKNVVGGETDLQGISTPIEDIISESRLLETKEEIKNKEERESLNLNTGGTAGFSNDSTNIIS